MKKLFFTISLFAVTAFVSAQSSTYVSGYTKSDGTYVQGYYKTTSDNTNTNNYSTSGNTNPYTGESGTKPKDYSTESSIYSADKNVQTGQRGGEIASNIKETNNEKKKIVIGNNVILNNINMNPNEMGTLYVSFSFLTKEITDKEKYRYHIIQKDSETGEIMGGETFEIQKNERPLFVANAGDNVEQVIESKNLIKN
ncbi:MAG: hypothetical protein L6262_00105 [Weeksellaceae bacterium]|nr:hypothetical protein [Weeksellaceae bacterium]